MCYASCICLKQKDTSYPIIVYQSKLFVVSPSAVVVRLKAVKHTFLIFSHDLLESSNIRQKQPVPSCKVQAQAD